MVPSVCTRQAGGAIFKGNRKMEWRIIETAPNNEEQILVGFMGQFKWFSYVANAYGKNTGHNMPFASPTHWTRIIPPKE